MESLGLTPYKVGLQWIVESMLMGQPVPESDFPMPSEETRCRSCQKLQILVYAYLLLQIFVTCAFYVFVERSSTKERPH
jgi:uncharacterized radical SAM superfamily Fe-S cluster-containing enzyme